MTMEQHTHDILFPKVEIIGYNVMIDELNFFDLLKVI